MSTSSGQMEWLLGKSRKLHAVMPAAGALHMSHNGATTTIPSSRRRSALVLLCPVGMASLLRLHEAGAIEFTAAPQQCMQCNATQSLICVWSCTHRSPLGRRGCGARRACGAHMLMGTRHQPHGMWSVGSGGLLGLWLGLQPVWLQRTSPAGLRISSSSRLTLCLMWAAVWVMPLRVGTVLRRAGCGFWWLAQPLA